ncbi:HK97-gp10 family putative phage morphogenesis protein [Nocardioides sp. SYSU DS0663]|uniref:HK97-gp10 family putative phage morphogenesis protein n=1 Tax=Nocardioides sp. SYSU DS0663 TaxID=3416445 RepID=UPI003F4B73DF
MGIELDTSAVRDLGSRLTTSTGRVGAATSAALRRTALAIEADAKALAPVDTGALQGSISTTISGDGRHGAMAAEIGPTVDYGVYQEYGTSTQAGTPFLGPAFDRQVPGYTAALAQLASDVL